METTGESGDGDGGNEIRARKMPKPATPTESYQDELLLEIRWIRDRLESLAKATWISTALQLFWTGIALAVLVLVYRILP
ncbi:MAG TPA: hypothetical protein VJ397_03465 [Thermoplasmata archaeon]|nr:hypothetical protein [Thermoplasmata archaeon]